MSGPDFAARLRAYVNSDDLCPCGQRRGHTGWLVCLSTDDPELPTQAHSAHQEDTHVPVPPPT